MDTEADEFVVPSRRGSDVMTARRATLTDGRMHFQHGPIDLVIGADGDAGAVAQAHEAGWRRFEPLLGELVDELPLLRRPVDARADRALRGVVARRMWHAAAAHAPRFATPMIAVAGAVADEIIGCYRRDGITRAWVDNGGDIALHLTAGQSVRIGLVADPTRLKVSRNGIAPDGRFALHHDQPVRGVATSGWRGRSFSLGIADSVTMLAATAAQADAAATMIANAVDVTDSRIIRRPANSLRDDTDLGDMLVTVDVPPLPAALIAQALARGLERAQNLRDTGRAWHAILTCQGQVVTSFDGVEDTAFDDRRIRSINALPKLADRSFELAA